MVRFLRIGSFLDRVARRFERRFWKLRTFSATRTQWVAAPFSLSTYKDGLTAILESGFRAPHFSSTDSPGERPDVYFRHDIDLSECPERLPAMIDVEQRLGIRSGVFFQANKRAPYELKSCRSLAAELETAGVEVGLHTICYTAPSPWIALKEEIHRFQDALAMQPRSFNAHGLGSFMLAERVAFYREVTPRRLAELGFAYSDLCDSLRRYDYVVEDCHVVPGFSVNPNVDPFVGLNLPTAARYMKDDLLTLPDLRGVRYLVLTHPGYWRR